MHNINVDIEDAGLDVLLIGLKHSAYGSNPLFKQLYVALSLEWASRQTNETSQKAVELPGVGALTDTELREAAGFLYGLCCAVDVEQYQKTFRFCFTLLMGLLEEINLRAPEHAETIH